MGGHIGPRPEGNNPYIPDVTTDPYFSSVSLLLHGNGINGAQNNTFLDSSINNITITRNGTPSQGTFNPFVSSPPYSPSVNGGSMYFIGNVANRLSSASNAAVALGTGDFTIEYWVYSISFATSPTVFDTRSSPSSSDGYSDYFEASGVFNLYLNNVPVYASSSAVPTNAWTHIAVTRSGTSVRVFFNGVQNGSTISNSTNMTNTTSLVGVNVNLVNPFNGYISNLRLVKGTAVYTSNFTTPTAPLTAITNTSLLLSGTNAGIFDNAIKNNLETVGNAQVSTIVKKFGTGSMSFDGTGDYIATNTPNTNLFEFGSGDFTIEFWLYSTSFATAFKGIYDQRPASTQGLYPTIYVETSGVIFYYTNSANRITGNTLSTNTWYHIAVCRSSSSTKLFVNGVQVGSTYTDSNIYLNSSGRPFIGAFSDNQVANQQFNGYIDDLRITKGVARYTSDFIPPTAAFPNS